MQTTKLMSMLTEDASSPFKNYLLTNKFFYVKDPEEVWDEYVAKCKALDAKMEAKDAKSDRASEHVALLICVQGDDTWLLKNVYNEDYGINDVIKAKVVFTEICLLRWNRVRLAFPSKKRV